MVLCIDCGNTLIKCGLYDETHLVKKFSLDSKIKRSSSEFEMVFSSFLKDFDNISGAIISCVVPLLLQPIKDALNSLFNINPLLINRSIKTGINIKIDYPNELGNDLLCGAVGAISKYSYPLVVADLGTATKMYVVDKDGNYIGGIITSGMEVSMKALDQSTSLLLEVPLISPKKIIGKNTKDSIQSGIVYGQAYMISEFARRMEQELGYKLERVLTGGFSKEIKDQVVCFHYEENLVLDGLYKIYHLNERKNFL